MKKLKISLTLLVTKEDLDGEDTLKDIIKYLQNDVKICIQEELGYSVADLEIVEGT